MLEDIAAAVDKACVPPRNSPKGEFLAHSHHSHIFPTAWWNILFVSNYYWGNWINVHICTCRKIDICGCKNVSHCSCYTSVPSMPDKYTNTAVLCLAARCFWLLAQLAGMKNKDNRFTLVWIVVALLSDGIVTFTQVVSVGTRDAEVSPTKKNQVFKATIPLHVLIHVVTHAAQLQSSLKSLHWSPHHDNLTDRLIGRGRWDVTGEKYGGKIDFSSSCINQIAYRRAIISKNGFNTAH